MLELAKQEADDISRLAGQGPDPRPVHRDQAVVTDLLAGMQC
jgi:hypothetical protein